MNGLTVLGVLILIALFAGLLAYNPDRNGDDQ